MSLSGTTVEGPPPVFSASIFNALAFAFVFDFHRAKAYKIKYLAFII